MFVLCLAAVFAISTSVAQRTSECPDGFDYLPEIDQCLKLITVKNTWRDARAACSKMAVGGQLLAITSSAKQEAIKKYLEPKLAKIEDCFLPPWHNDRNFVWINAQRQTPCRCDTPFVWKYKNGGEIPLDFTYWRSGQPDCDKNGEHCAHFTQALDYRWNDVPCTFLMCSVCEI